MFEPKRAIVSIPRGPFEHFAHVMGVDPATLPGPGPRELTLVQLECVTDRALLEARDDALSVELRLELLILALTALEALEDMLCTPWWCRWCRRNV